MQYSYANIEQAETDTLANTMYRLLDVADFSNTLVTTALHVDTGCLQAKNLPRGRRCTARVVDHAVNP